MEYRIDTQPLEVLRENNYLMSILECLQPSGEIPAGRTIPVQFVFSPLEAKRYVVGYITSLCAHAETRKRLLLFRFWSQTVRLCMGISPSSMYENAVTVLLYRMERTHRALVKISLIPSLLPSLDTKLSKDIVTLPLYAMHGSLLKNKLVPKLCKLMCPGVCNSDNL